MTTTLTSRVRKERSAHEPDRKSPASFAEMLVEAGRLSQEEVNKASEIARREGLTLGRVLVREELILPRELSVLSALFLNLTMVELATLTIDPEALALVPKELGRKYVVLPVRREGRRFTVAMADPLDVQCIQNLTARTGCTIEPLVANPEDILQHIEICYRFNQPLRGGPSPALMGRGERVTANVLRERPPAEVIDLLLRQALQDRASDIHIEPADARLRLRFRIDGILHEIMNLPLEMHPALISRLKIMAGMNIAERRRSQDGQFSVDFDNRKVDVRVAVANTVLGETMVLRILDKSFTLLGLEQLGISPEALSRYRQLVQSPHGMLIICGPTGSGKSTTLYASVLQSNRTEQNVISIEDPVEYRIVDANQMQVHAEAGITFATQLRSILRLDPNVVLVGEVRDQETAAIATQASLTGHLVLTSLHANDCISALLRIRDLGVAPYLTASSVIGIVAQRMVRLVCTSCRVMTSRPLAEQQAFAEVMGEARKQFVYGAGCNMCAQTGYRGRTGVFEILPLSDELRSLFLLGEPHHRLREQALREGMVTLRKDGMMKVKAGITTPYEVMRNLVGHG